MPDGRPRCLSPVRGSRLRTGGRKYPRTWYLHIFSHFVAHVRGMGHVTKADKAATKPALQDKNRDNNHLHLVIIFPFTRAICNRRRATKLVTTSSAVFFFWGRNNMESSSFVLKDAMLANGLLPQAGVKEANIFAYFQLERTTIKLKNRLRVRKYLSCFEGDGDARA